MSPSRSSSHTSSSPTLEILLETKKDNLLHLQNLLTEPVYVELQKIYKSAQEKAPVDKILEQFQEQLTLIPHWNVNQVTALKERVIERMNCDYFSELLKSTFMVYLQLHLATLSQKISSTPMKIKVPSSEAFIHRLLVAVARLLWKKPYIMYDKVRSLEKQKNLLQCESLIHKSIRQTIMNSLPLNEIYRYISKETLVRPSDSGGEETSLDSATDDPTQAESESTDSDDSTESDTENESDSETTPTLKPSSAPSESESESESEEESESESETETPQMSKPSLSTEVPENVSESESESESEKTETLKPTLESSESEDEEEEPKEMNLVRFSEPETKKIEIVSKDKISKSRHGSIHRPVVNKVLPNASKRPSDAFF